MDFEEKMEPEAGNSEIRVKKEPVNFEVLVKSEPEVVWLVTPDSLLMASAQQDCQQEPEASGSNSWSDNNNGLQQGTVSDFCQIFIKEEIHEPNMEGGSADEPALESEEFKISTSMKQLGSESIQQNVSNNLLKPIPRSNFNKTTKENCFVCTLCNRKYASSSRLKIHYRLHTGERIFSCEICDYKFPDASDLKRHHRSHTGEKPYCCELCGFRASQSGHLKAHVRRHTKETPFSCEFCGCKFKNPSDLKTHLGKHAEETSRKENSKECTTELAPEGAEQNKSKELQVESVENVEFTTYMSIDDLGSGSISQIESNDPLKLVPEDHFNKCIKEQSEKCTTSVSIKELGAGSVQHNELLDHIKLMPNNFNENKMKKPFSCEFCERKYTSSSKLKIHYRLHTGERIFSCEICDYKFSNASDLKRHKRSHTGEKPYSCKLCGFIATQSGHLKAHIRRHTEETPFSCEFCGCKFKKPSDLKTHCGKLAEETSRKERSKECTTELAPEGAEQNKSKKLQLESVESVEFTTYISSDDLGSGNIGQIESNNPLRLVPEEHFNKHIEEQSEKCMTSISIKELGARNVAQNVSNDLPQFTDYNAVELMPRNNFSKHEKEKPKDCTTSISMKELGAGSVQQNELNDNLKLMPNNFNGDKKEKLFSCELCERKYMSLSTLKIHHRLHTGERIFSCEICDHKFSSSSDFKRHFRTHTGEKPYSCKFCDFKATQSGHLKAHLEIHSEEKPFSCGLCTFRCRRWGDFKLHRRRHEEEKRVNCEFCEFSCWGMSNLYKHLKKKHI